MPAKKQVFFLEFIVLKIFFLFIAYSLFLIHHSYFFTTRTYGLFLTFSQSVF